MRGQSQMEAGPRADTVAAAAKGGSARGAADADRPCVYTHTHTHTQVEHAGIAGLAATVTFCRSCGYFTTAGKAVLPALRAAWRAPLRPNCEATPSTRWVELRFLTQVIW